MLRGLLTEAAAVGRPLFSLFSHPAGEPPENRVPVPHQSTFVFQMPPQPSCGQQVDSAQQNAVYTSVIDTSIGCGESAQMQQDRRQGAQPAHQAEPSAWPRTLAWQACTCCCSAGAGRGGAGHAGGGGGRRGGGGAAAGGRPGGGRHAAPPAHRRHRAGERSLFCAHCCFYTAVEYLVACPGGMRACWLSDTATTTQSSPPA